jgi:hypothetical protein
MPPRAANVPDEVIDRAERIAIVILFNARRWR